MKNEWVYIGAAVYVALFILSIVGLFLWKIKRKGGRMPVDFRLLRGPGETLRQRIRAFDEDFLFKLILAGLLPPLIAAFVAAFTPKLGLKTWPQLWTWFGIIVAIFAGALIPVARWALRELARYRGDKLGYLGEREVAERLQPLWAKGYMVFHDVPCEGRKADFNLDHVAVGRTGVAVIETKTRRKGRPRPDGSEYRVAYDGQRLLWPWGPETAAVKQVIAQADWLRRFIEQRTRIVTPVKPIIAIPGWWVDPAPGAVLVVNAKNVASAVEDRGSTALSPAEIELIALQLEVLCRDVED